MAADPNLASIIETARPLAPAPAGLSTTKLFDHPTEGPLKLRVYATVDEAKAIAGWLGQTAGKIATHELLGREGNVLVFRFIPPDLLQQEVTSEVFYHAIGRFLGILNRERVAGAVTATLDREYAAWLDRFSAMQIITSRVARQAGALYQQIRPPDLPICLDYWDAMYHNFGMRKGELILLDEKHLRPSFPYIGLIKPAFLLESAEWQACLEGYQSCAPIDNFNRHRPFFILYYLTAALYFYSLIGEAGREDLVRNQRFLLYREAFIHQASRGRAGESLLSELDLYRSNPGAVPFLLRRRIGLAGRNLFRKSPGFPTRQSLLQASPDA